jgi:hypothetical protein
MKLCAAASEFRPIAHGYKESVRAMDGIATGSPTYASHCFPPDPKLFMVAHQERIHHGTFGYDEGFVEVRGKTNRPNRNRFVRHESVPKLTGVSRFHNRYGPLDHNYLDSNTPYPVSHRSAPRFQAMDQTVS